MKSVSALPPGALALNPIPKRPTPSLVGLEARRRAAALLGVDLPHRAVAVVDPRVGAAIDGHRVDVDAVRAVDAPEQVERVVRGVVRVELALLGRDVDERRLGDAARGRAAVADEAGFAGVVPGDGGLALAGRSLESSEASSPASSGPGRAWLPVLPHAPTVHTAATAKATRAARGRMNAKHSARLAEMPRANPKCTANAPPGPPLRPRVQPRAGPVDARPPGHGSPGTLLRRPRSVGPRRPARARGCGRGREARPRGGVVPEQDLFFGATLTHGRAPSAPIAVTAESALPATTPVLVAPAPGVQDPPPIVQAAPEGVAFRIERPPRV